MFSPAQYDETHPVSQPHFGHLIKLLHPWCLFVMQLFLSNLLIHGFSLLNSITVPLLSELSGRRMNVQSPSFPVSVEALLYTMNPALSSIFYFAISNYFSFSACSITIQNPIIWTGSLLIWAFPEWGAEGQRGSNDGIALIY